MLVPSDASALPRGANTRRQNVKPYSSGSLLGKYHFSANAHSTRLSSGPKMMNASKAQQRRAHERAGSARASGAHAARSWRRSMLPTE